MKLVSGTGSEETGACWMSALHWYTRLGASWTDQPECVSPVVRKLCIKLNDRLLTDADRERVIGPHLFVPVGTATGNADEIARAYLCADRAVRVFAPYVLRAIDLDVQAAKLEALPEIASAASAARSAAWAARAAAGAARAAGATAWAARAAEAAAEAARAAASAARSAAWYEREMIRLILDCCAIGRKADVQPTRTKEELMAFLCRT